MKQKKKNHVDEKIPYFEELISFYKHINASPPLSEDFDIREINPDVLKAFDYVAKPFRHNLYCIAFYLEGDVTLNTGFWKTKLDKPAIYFKTPCQILSWAKPAKWLKEYFIVFTESFILKHKPLADIIFALPFFKLEKAIPLEIEPEDVDMLTDLYKKINKEYRSSNTDKYDLIHSYTYELLIHLRRLFIKYSETDLYLVQKIKTNDNTLVDKFLSLIKKHISSNKMGDEMHSVKFYAGLLSTHPNHLNAVVKRITQKNALSLIHEQIIIEAKSLLTQTDLPIKVIAFNLGFKEYSHFNNFFKKRINITPSSYRKGGLL
jgi:AraC family transcriptional regulator, transcriptional activator of pobA